MENEKQFSLDDYQINVVSVRLVRDRVITSATPISSPMDAVDFIGRDLAEWDREAIILLCLDNQNHVVNLSLQSIGTTSMSISSLRELLKVPILANASSVLLMHNHPSFLPRGISPSEEDIQLTENLVAVCNLLSIEVLDHIIVGNTGTFSYFSFKESDMLRPSEKVFQIVDDTKRKRKKTSAMAAEGKPARKRSRR